MVRACSLFSCRTASFYVSGENGAAEFARLRLSLKQSAALMRETWEELQVTPTEFTRIGEIWYAEAEWLFHVYLVTAWGGEIPPHILDHQRPLNWINPADLDDNPSMIGISALIRSTLAER